MNWKLRRDRVGHRIPFVVYVLLCYSVEHSRETRVGYWGGPRSAAKSYLTLQGIDFIRLFHQSPLKSVYELLPHACNPNTRKDETGGLL